MIVAIEGIDASGKATQTKRLVKRFEACGFKSERFDFPRYQSFVGKEILALLTQKWSPMTELEQVGTDARIVAELPETRALVIQALMTINRYEHYDYLKEWSESSEGILVLDRYYGSGIVYGESDGLDKEFLLEIHKALPKPDAWVFVDITAEESVRRRPDRRDEYEKREGFMEKVRQGYLTLFSERNEAGEPWYVVNGEGSEDDVHERIWELTGETSK
jgi:dTMP kinase